MKKSSFDAALRAAAKVTFGTTLLGCGANVVQESDGVGGGGGNAEGGSAEVATGGGADRPAIVATGGGGVGGSAPTMPSLCEEPTMPASGWQAYDEPTFDCCVERIAASANVDKEGCCIQILSENYDALWSGQPLIHDAPEAVITECCELRHGNAACTPWGPPPPPFIGPEDFVPWIEGVA